MAALSKFGALSLPYNCYEVVHTWTPDCNEAALSLGFSVLVEGVKLYTPLYLISQLVLRRKYSLKEFWNTVLDICTSSCFLGFHGFAYALMLCLLRKSIGKFYLLSTAFLPAFVAGFLAILIERKNRRGPLTLYAINVTSETLFRMATARGIITPVKNGEVLLFSASMALFLYSARRHGFSRNYVSTAFKYIFGKEETSQQDKALAVGRSGSIKRLPYESIPSLNCLGSMPESSSLLKRSGFLWTLWNETKHKSCPHSLSCMQYSLQGFLRPFVIGNLAYSAMFCLSMGKKIFLNPSLLKSLLTEKKTLKFALFLGSFGGTFRAINCLLRWCFNKDQALYVLPAAFLGGLFMKFFPSSTLALYLTWKVIEIGYALGIEEGVLPKVRGSMLFLYAISAAVIFHAFTFEPYNLKPGYLKFLTRITQNKLGAINRHVLDVFGTHASKMYSDFWPEIDLKYASRAFQENVLLWLIR